MKYDKKPVLAMTDSDRLRFYSKIRENPVNGCHEWVAAKNTSGYGIFRVGCYQSMIAAHRVAFMLHHKTELPAYAEGDSTMVLHTCDNRICCNPAHLWLGTRDDNAKDAAKKGRIVHGGSPPPVGLGEANGHAILDTEAVLYIRETVAKKNPKKGTADSSALRKALAWHFGVSISSISDIITGRSWKHI